ncbi:MAG: ABC transporter ATP-binding protein [Nitrososphaerota archaeon]|nr:ABC transporter ATP-binding protein [Candidatus Calditenuaceae archaeon]MDW8073179.1 ABC transporter ATP-binding protein [Nitrososphaerota archaeon]
MANVEVESLTRVFETRSRRVLALDNVNLEVEKGEVFGLLGPNGAGKTTLIRILTTLLLPTSGRAVVGGFDVVKEAKKVRGIIGFSSSSERVGFDFVTARRNLWFFSQLYGVPKSEADRRIEELASLLEFQDQLDRKLYMLTTGYKQRLNLARALINDPTVVFFDEPTNGMDVFSAKKVRELFVREARVNSRTVFLATHNMFEAEEICDRVAIIDRGRILAVDTPENLKLTLDKPVVMLETDVAGASVGDPRTLDGVVGGTVKLDSESETANIRVILRDEDYLDKVVTLLERRGVKVLGYQRLEPTLEDVFISKVGAGFAERERSLEV